MLIAKQFGIFNLVWLSIANRICGIYRKYELRILNFAGLLKTVGHYRSYIDDENFIFVTPGRKFEFLSGGNISCTGNNIFIYLNGKIT